MIDKSVIENLSDDEKTLLEKLKSLSVRNPKKRKVHAGDPYLLLIKNKCLLCKKSWKDYFAMKQSVELGGLMAKAISLQEFEEDSEMKHKTSSQEHITCLSCQKFLESRDKDELIKMIFNLKRYNRI